MDMRIPRSLDGSRVATHVAERAAIRDPAIHDPLDCSYRSRAGIVDLGVNMSTTLKFTGRHGTDCPKVEHIGEGYLHDENWDQPYEVDGLCYCGRCHAWLGIVLNVQERKGKRG